MKVCVRVRPLLKHEQSIEKVVDVQHEMNAIHVYDERTKNDVRAAYDAVMDEQSTQEDAFKLVSDYTAHFLNGYNCTLFAYG